MLGMTVDSLKSECKMIHYFGLGFIQVKMSDTIRYHFYLPSGTLPVTAPEEEIHNHRQGFKSYILKGALSQSIYEQTEGNSYECVPVSCDPKNAIKGIGSPCNFRVVARMHLKEGSFYSVHHNTFHNVRSTFGAITALKMGPKQKEYAYVIRPIGSPEVCPFSIVIPEAKLWELVDASLNEPMRKFAPQEFHEQMDLDNSI